MTKEKFILVSLKEKESKLLAQIVSNDTARKILDYLAEKEATETELSEKLAVPLSTAHYNLKALVKAKLVEADEYHYSKKGKEVLHYKLANKYIIIAPKSTYGIREKLKSILPVGIFVALGSWIVSLMGRTTTLATGIVEQGAELMNAEAPLAASKVAPLLGDEAGNVMMQFGADAVAEAAPQTAEIARAGFQMSPALWFLLGSVVAVLLLLLIDYINYRRKK